MGEDGVTISGAAVVKGVGGVLATLVTVAILYVAVSIPEIKTEIAVIAAAISDQKERDRVQWAEIKQVNERVTTIREYLAERGWAKENHK